LIYLTVQGTDFWALAEAARAIEAKIAEAQAAKAPVTLPLKAQEPSPNEHTHYVPSATPAAIPTGAGVKLTGEEVVKFKAQVNTLEENFGSLQKAYSENTARYEKANSENAARYEKLEKMIAKLIDQSTATLKRKRDDADLEPTNDELPKSKKLAPLRAASMSREDQMMMASYLSLPSKK
jgi:hypothetical protein